VAVVEVVNLVLIKVAEQLDLQDRDIMVAQVITMVTIGMLVEVEVVLAQ
jgi:hypothetical protein